MRALRLAFVVLVLGCAPNHTRVPFDVVLLGDDATLGATAIAVTLEHAGVRDASTTVRFAPNDRALDLGPLPYGDDDVLVVETERSGLVLGRGRSFPFSITAPGASRRPDVSLGVLGRFASLDTATSDAFTTIVPTDDGALLASAAGVTHFLAHGAMAGAPVLLATTPWPAARVGGTSVALGGAVLVVGGASAGASLVAADGSVLGELDASAIAAAHGVALTAIDDGTVLAIGGMDGSGALLHDVVRVTWNGTRLGASALMRLPAMRTDARAVALDVRDAGGEITRAVLVLDGHGDTGPASDVVLLDPMDVIPPASVVVPSITHDAAICALDTNLVLLAGGDDDTGTTINTVTILVVQRTGTPPISALAPSPPVLFHPRTSASAVALGAGVALVVGGLDPNHAPITDAEILEVRLDFLPGDVALTGALAHAGTVTAAGRLGDRTVLVSTDGTLSLYFPPRGD